jgi:hypothetical protein
MNPVKNVCACHEWAGRETNTHGIQDLPPRNHHPISPCYQSSTLTLGRKNTIYTDKNDFMKDKSCNQKTKDKKKTKTRKKEANQRCVRIRNVPFRSFHLFFCVNYHHNINIHGKNVVKCWAMKQQTCFILSICSLILVIYSSELNPHLFPFFL